MEKRSKRNVFIGLLGAGIFGAGPLLAALPGAAVQPPNTGKPVAGTSPAMAMWTNEVPTPPNIDLTAGGAQTLREIPGTHSFGTTATGTDVRVPSFAYLPDGESPGTGGPFGAAGPYLGPTLEVQRGNPVDLTVINDLRNVTNPMGAFQDTTIMAATTLDNYFPRTATHLHGGHVQDDADGGPMETYRASPTGGSATNPTYQTTNGTYTVDNSATTSAGNVTAPDTTVSASTPDISLKGTPGQYKYHYANDQEAAGLWYHDHALGQTRFNPYGGLAGHYIVRDNNDTGRRRRAASNLSPIGLPTGEYEVPLVFQDKQFTPAGTAYYQPPPPPGAQHPMWIPESFGDVPTVNGLAWPKKTVGQGLYRFRLLNGSNARAYNFSLVDPKNQNKTAPVPVWQVGSDGGLLKTPAQVGSKQLPKLLLMPGERADVVIDFSAALPGQTFMLTNDAPTPYPAGPTAVRRGGVPMPNVMQFAVSAPAAAGVTPALNPPKGPAPTALPGDAPAVAVPPPPAPATALPPCRDPQHRSRGRYRLHPDRVPQRGTRRGGLPRRGVAEQHQLRLQPCHGAGIAADGPDAATGRSRSGTGSRRTEGRHHGGVADREHHRRCPSDSPAPVAVPDPPEAIGQRGEVPRCREPGPPAVHQRWGRCRVAGGFDPRRGGDAERRCKPASGSHPVPRQAGHPARTERAGLEGHCSRDAR